MYVHDNGKRSVKYQLLTTKHKRSKSVISVEIYAVTPLNYC